jgi:hypothetical protein
MLEGHLGMTKKPLTETPLMRFVYSIIFIRNSFFSKRILKMKYYWKRFVQLKPDINPVSIIFYFRTLIHFMQKSSLYIHDEKELYFFIGKYLEKLRHLKLIQGSSSPFLGMILQKLIVQSKCMKGKINL